MSSSSSSSSQQHVCPACTLSFDKTKRAPYILLGCSHTLCNECITAYRDPVVGKDDYAIMLECPLCKKETKCPKLKKNTFVERTIQLNDDAVLDPKACTRHPLKTADHVCIEKTCARPNDIVCEQCSEVPLHRGHKFDNVENVVKKMRHKLQKQCAKVEKALPLLRGPRDEHLIVDAFNDATREKRQRFIDEYDAKTNARIEQYKKKRTESLTAILERADEANNAEHMHFNVDHGMSALKSVYQRAKSLKPITGRMFIMQTAPLFQRLEYAHLVDQRHALTKLLRAPSGGLFSDFTFTVNASDATTTSPAFVIGTHEFKFSCWPQGNPVWHTPGKCMAVRLSITKPVYGDQTWARTLEFQLRLVNHGDHMRDITKTDAVAFHERCTSHRWEQFTETDAITDPNAGFLIDNTLTFELTVTDTTSWN